MRSNEPRRAPAWRGYALVLMAFAGLAGCAPPPQMGEYGDDPLCGIAYSCDHDSDTNRGGEQTATGESSNSSSSSSSSAGGEDTTGGEGATAGDED